MKQLLSDLQERIRQLEHGQRHTRWPGRVSSGFASLDRLLPHQGFVGGTLVEWLSDGPGSGAMTLAVAIAGRLVQADSGVLVVIDAEREFFPPAAAELGVPLERTVVVQPSDEQTRWWALEQALRSDAVTATLGHIGPVDDRVLRRLQLAAETGGGLGLLIRPSVCRSSISWADLRLLVKALASTSAENWRLQVELLACRGGAAGGKGVVEIG